MQYQNTNPVESSFCPTNKVDWQRLPDRMVYTNLPDTQVTNNNIKTTNTTIFTFIPSNLISQLSKSANIYFLVVAVLQSIRGVSVTNGQPLVLLPLSMVMIAVLLKDAYEQYNRHKKDRQANNQPVQVLKNGNFQLTTWENLLIGNVIRVKKQEFAPCDFVVLQSSDPKGKCYVQTKSLDGQTNQKIKKVPAVQKFNLKSLTPSQLQNQRYELKYQKPNPNLHSFNGNIKIHQQVLPLTDSNIILRGSSVQNVDWVTGVCVYTGKQTKLSLNSVQFRTKRSNLDKLLGDVIIVIVIMQMLISFACAGFNFLMQSRHLRQLHDIPGKPFWMSMGSWWLIMSYFIPISLVVSLESIRLAQALMMVNDQRMISNANKTSPQMNNSSVNQDLGQIRYVFSDKTGTLTSNIMNFKMFSASGKTYGSLQKSKIQQNISLNESITNVDFNDENFMKKRSDKQFNDFFKVLYLCHQIIIQNTPSGIKYNGSSSDQVAFINFCKLCGFQYLGQQNHSMTIKNTSTNEITKYKILSILEFSSDRKRMSVIVQQPSGDINLYMKGADSLISPKIKQGDPLLKKTLQHIEQFSNNGLRTLLLAKRSVTQQQFNQWYQKYHAAITSISNRQKHIEEACDLIQTNLSVIGATGIQDKLQDNVKQTIEQMRECGIVFYILTGDKRQTALNIGRSCGMVSKTTKIITAPEELNPEQFVRWTQQNFPLPPNSVLLLNAGLPITNISIPLHSTICYRCTPTQKQNIVKSVKAQTTQLTLAIGDGSNDVNMVTVADVGISIRGIEGNDVTRVSDFVIGQFCLLAPLVLYYGRQWYRKNSKFVNYGMIKNIFHVASVIGFGMYSMFSGIVIYEPVIYHFFNTFFTIAPICVYAVTDEDWTMDQSVKYPALLYPPGQKGRYFNFKTYWKSLFLGVFYGILTQFLVYFLLQHSPLNKGRVSYLSEGGMVILFVIVFIVNIKALLMAHVYPLLLILSVIASLLAYFGIYLGFIWYYPNSQVAQSLRTLFTTPLIWMILIIVCFITLVLDFGLKKWADFHKNMVFNQQAQFKEAKLSR